MECLIIFACSCVVRVACNFRASDYNNRSAMPSVTLSHASTWLDFIVHTLVVRLIRQVNISVREIEKEREASKNPIENVLAKSMLYKQKSQNTTEFRNEIKDNKERHFAWKKNERSRTTPRINMHTSVTSSHQVPFRNEIYICCHSP